MDRTQKLVIEIDPQRATVVLKQEILGVISRKEICPEDLFQAIIHATNRNSFISSGLLPKGCFSVEIENCAFAVRGILANDHTREP